MNRRQFLRGVVGAAAAAAVPVPAAAAPAVEFVTEAEGLPDIPPLPPRPADIAYLLEQSIRKIYLGTLPDWSRLYRLELTDADGLPQS